MTKELYVIVVPKRNRVVMCYIRFDRVFCSDMYHCYKFCSCN